jgi:hypothetical protein
MTDQPPAQHAPPMNALRRTPGHRFGLVVLEVVEDAIYAIIALFLIGSGSLLMFGAGLYIAQNFNVNNIHDMIVHVLDETLLVFMVVELLHTVRITLRDHALAAEPFLVVGLIAGVRLLRLLGAAAPAHRARCRHGRGAVHLAAVDDPARQGTEDPVNRQLTAGSPRREL